MNIQENKQQHPPCPRCLGMIPNNEFAGMYPGALSRMDNKTEICSACGTEEAIADYTGDNKYEVSDWPIFSHRALEAIEILNFGVKES